MKRSAAFVVVAVVLCIILSSEASGDLTCTGERQSDGQFFFKLLVGDNKAVSDCETQWLINGKVVGIFDADGNVTFVPPITMATANTSIIQTCPENLKCLLICPVANINEEEHCSCNDTPPTTLPEVGSPKWQLGVGIGIVIGIAVLILLVIFLVRYRRRQRSRYNQTSSAPDSEII